MSPMPSDVDGRAGYLQILNLPTLAMLEKVSCPNLRAGTDILGALTRVLMPDCP